MNMCAEKLESATTLIVGMGLSGLSCARYLRQQGVDFCLIDSREDLASLASIQEEFASYTVRAGDFDEKYLFGMKRLIVSPGIPLAHPFIQLAIRRGIEVIGDIELFAQHAEAPIIAITGSNGKSTVTALLGEMLQAGGVKVAVGGNIGTPVLDLLEEPLPDVYVLELSSFQLETTKSLRPKAATVLNVSDDHMDRYANLSAYVASKASIYRNAEYCIVNKDDATVMSMVADNSAPKVFFTMSSPSNNEFGLLEHATQTWLAYGEQRLLKLDELKIVGRHNAGNALAALALAHAFSVKLEWLLPALKSFAGLPHRCQLVAEHNGVRWVNDSKATNIGSAQAAIESVSGSLILIAGGDGKGADFSVLRDVVANYVSDVILLGKAAPALHAVLKNTANCRSVGNIKEAVSLAATLAKSGDTVLLAPACSSLDMFENYIERGQVFIDCVYKELGL